MVLAVLAWATFAAAAGHPTRTDPHGVTYHGPMDFNCTSPPLAVSWGAPVGAAGCGSKHSKMEAGFATPPMVKW